jgi:outer membrane protein TolC
MNKTLLALLAGLMLSVSGPVLAVDLGDAIASAEKMDPNLASAMANRDAAYDNIAIAKAKLLPQTGFQGSYQKLQEGVRQVGGILGGVSSMYDVSAYNYSVSLRQGLYHPRDWAGYDIGKLQAEYGVQKLASARSDLWMRISNAWLDLLAAAEQRGIYVDTVAVTATAADQAAQRMRSGDGTRDVMIEAEAQHELAKSQLLEAEVNLKSKIESFRLLTGLDAANMSAWHLPDFRVTRIAVSEKGEFQQVVENTNPEVLAAQANYEIKRKQVDQARADRLPTVDLIASRSWAQSDTIATLNQVYNVLGGGIQVSIPLYDGGGLAATQHQAEATARAAAADLLTEKQKLSAQVESDWASAQASLERAKSAETLWMAAKEQKRAYELGLKSGVRTWADIAQAEILIAHRASDYVNYAAAVLRAQAHLLSALPVTENIWEPWVAQVSVLAKR